MRTSLPLVITLAVLLWICEAKGNNANEANKTKAGVVTSSSRGLHGYISYSATRPPDRVTYSAGMGFYAAVWPLIDKPIARFQIGLPSAWISPDNSDNKDKPLAPIGTHARDNWPERGPTWGSVFQTVEGGLGYWARNHFRYGPPKFSLNATPQCYDYEVGSPGWSFFYSNKALPDNRLGIAQLSNRLLIPPDALPFQGNPNGKFLGITYMALPFTEPTTGDPPTGDQAWTCFLSAANFKGPMAYYIPETWSKIGKLFNYPFIYGRGLDARPGRMGGGAMEINTVPCFRSRDSKGVVYSKLPRLQFPVDDKGRTLLVQDVTYYSKATLYDAFKAWRDGGPACSGKFDEKGAYRSKLSTRTPRFDQGGKRIIGIDKIFDTKILESNVWGLEWRDGTRNANGYFPQYFKHVGDERVAVSAADVPEETQLLNKEFRLAGRGAPYTSPTGGAWGNPGPKSGPYKVDLADGSTVTYSWYRFIDQPSFQQYNWSEEKKAKLQSFVEKIHTNWPIDRDYMVPLSSGKLAAFDPALLVTPPDGMEVGYVPIVTHQEDTNYIKNRSESSGFYAHYTRLAYDDDNNTGQYADIVVNLGHTGQLVFSRQYSYLPFWQASGKKHFVDRIIPFVGDGPAERPDKINKCSYVRIVEDTPDKIIVHWRYAPDQRRDSFTQFRETYCGDIGIYYAEYADEYFTIRTDGTVTRQVKTGCYKLDDWNDPANVVTQTMKLTSSGISVKKTTPARLQHLPGEPVKGPAVIEKSSQPPDLWMRFDEGLKPNGHTTIESVQGTQCVIGGMDSYWRAGVSGSCLSFDGYTNKVTVPASSVPQVSHGFTIQAWIAPQEYAWNWAGIVDRDQDKKAGYSLGMNHVGQIGMYAYVDGEWQGLMTSQKAALLTWTHVTAVYEMSRGFFMYFNGVLVGTKKTSGTVKDAMDLDLYVGMAHERQFPWAYERQITKQFLSNMVFSGRIDEVKIFDRALSPSDIYSDYLLSKPEVTKPLQFWVLPAGPAKADGFGAFYTKLECSPEWDGLWRVGKYADIVVAFEDNPCRFVFWRGTNYLPSLVSEPGPAGIWMSDQGPENYTDQCFEHMSDKMCRYSHVRLIENTDARVVVHWRNTSVGISYDWMEVDENGWGLWTDEYWYIYPDAAAVRYQVSRRLKDLPAQTQQNELMSQPGTRPEDNVPYDSVTLSNLNGDTETWNYSVGPTFLNSAPIKGSKNLVYTNINSRYKHFNIGEVGSWWKVYSQWESMRMAYGHSKYNAWNHYPFGLLPSDGTVATGKDRVTSSCLGTLYGLEHLLDDGRTELYNIYGMTDLPAPELKTLNRSWNTPADMASLKGGTSDGYDKRQRAYPITKKMDTITFSLAASEDNPVLNPCFVIKHWDRASAARVEIDQKKQTGKHVRQGIIRDTDGTKTMVIWLKQTSTQKTSYKIY